MNNLHFDALNIDKEWFKIGKERKENTEKDVAFKFIAYWIAFNAIFSQYSRFEGDNEAKQIRALVDVRYDKCLKGKINFDNNPVLNVFKEAPVFKSHFYPEEGFDYLNQRFPTNDRDIRRSIDIYKEFMCYNDDKEKLFNLLLMIKQVRNNLFHGKKTPYPERNYKLVDSSQKILETILKALIEFEEY